MTQGGRVDFHSFWKRAVSFGKSFEGRLLFVFLLLGLPFVREGWKLCSLHLGNHARISHTYKRTFIGMRGRIYDRNGTDHPMAVSLPIWEFFLDPQSVETNEKAAVVETIVTNLNQKSEWVLEQFQRTGRGSRHIKLGRSQDSRIHAALTAFRGIGADEIIIRQYPYGRRMSHVLGFVNRGGVGSSGIELALNTELSGAPGVIESEKDARRREIYSRRSTYAPPIPGHNVHLTLDLNIQSTVENVLKETVEKFTAIRGWCIVQKIKTGELLALATFPDFEPERYDEYTSDEWKNYALSSVYEPGSIMKSVTVSAFLNERLGNANTLINAEHGSWFYAGRPLRDHVTGYISVATALKKSSNVATAKMALQLGNGRLYAYLRAYNFGSKFSIGLEGEERGILAPPARWSKLSPTRISIGQGVAVTGLQMVSAYSALANEGKMMRPYLVDRIISANGEVIRQNRPEVIGRPVRPEVARQVCDMLTGVTESGGTGKRASVSGYSVAGKTGTAQKAVRGGYSQTDYYASFVGFVPASDPVFTVLVTVERPRPQHTGGYVSAPAFAKIATEVAQYLEIPPDEPDEITEKWEVEDDPL